MKIILFNFYGFTSEKIHSKKCIQKIKECLLKDYNIKAFEKIFMK